MYDVKTLEDKFIIVVALESYVHQLEMLYQAEVGINFIDSLDKLIKYSNIKNKRTHELEYAISKCKSIIKELEKF